MLDLAARQHPSNLSVCERAKRPGLGAGLLGDDPADVDQVVGDHAEANLALDTDQPSPTASRILRAC